MRIRTTLAVLTTRLEQNLRGARVVKAFAQENAEIARFDRENEKWFDLSVQSTRLQSTNAPLMDLIANLGTVLIIWYGGQLVIQGQLTLGELVSFSTYLAQLIQPIRRLGQIIPVVAIAAAAGELLIPVTLELGGKDAAIVLEDADLEAAVRTGVRARFQNTGQSCIAAKDSLSSNLFSKNTRMTSSMQSGL